MPRSFHSTAVVKKRPIAWGLILVGLLILLVGGCATTGVALRSAPKNPLSDQLKLTARGGPRPSPRTMQVLRVCNLQDELHGDPRKLLEKLQTVIDTKPSAELTYAFAELAYLGAKKAEARDPQLATDLYGASLLYAYHYLFDEQLAEVRNPYDMQFRGACDLYNGALEGALRIAAKGPGLMPGQSRTINTAAGSWDITCVLRGGKWRPEDFDHFEFVSDYEITGLTNQYQTYGLGVPLIAVRRSYPGEPAAAKYYPAGLSFPVTAFFRPGPDMGPCTGRCDHRRQGFLEFYDPLTTTDTRVGNRLVPLQNDLTTPLAFFLSNPQLSGLDTVGLLNPDALLQMRPGGKEPLMGLYMVQPYDPGKIPVVMVHGIWSSPMTWMEMFNDLRSSPEIRENYQFWFYLYPSGQPFWISATQMRRDLEEVRQVLDPHHQEPALDQTVLVGHSMGGLVSRLQTLSSKDDFWKLASTEPFEKIKGDPQTREKLRRAFFFRPNPSIRRVGTIGTPHRGSYVSNQTTQWLLGKLITLPQRLVQSQEKLFRDNRGAFQQRTILKVHNSIDSLAPDSPIFPTMLAAGRAPWVTYHNIVGLIPYKGWFSSLVAGSDGVVEQESAQMDDVVSQLTVPADHSSILSHPAAVLEVRRILLEHLAELRGYVTTEHAPVQEAAVVPTADPFLR